MMEALRDDRVAKTDWGASLRLVVPPRPAYARHVRARVDDFLADHAIPELDAQDFLIAVGEALANAIEHARTERKVETTCWIVGHDRLMATVVDAGIGFIAGERLVREARQPGPECERGRGLDIMRRCTDHVAIRSRPGHGTSVILMRYVRHRHLNVISGGAAGG